MIKASLLLVGLVAVLASLFGWGRQVCRLLERGSLPWGLVATIGLASWIVVGGVLNLVGVAYSAAFYVIVAMGWCACAWELGIVLRAGRHQVWPGWRRTVEFTTPWIAVAGIATFIGLTQVPPSAYNFHDDYMNYFVDPARMVQTGTVFGSPL